MFYKRNETPDYTACSNSLTPGWTDDEEFGQRSGIERSSNIRLRQLLRTKLAVNWEEWRHSGRPRQWTVLLSSWTLWSTITEYYANTYPLDENFPFRQLRFLISLFNEDDERIYETFHSFCVFNTMVKKNGKFINIFFKSYKPKYQNDISAFSEVLAILTRAIVEQLDSPKQTKLLKLITGRVSKSIFKQLNMWLDQTSTNQSTSKRNVGILEALLNFKMYRWNTWIWSRKVAIKFGVENGNCLSTQYRSTFNTISHKSTPNVSNKNVIIWLNLCFKWNEGR